MHGTNWRRGANFKNWFQSFASSNLHHFAWDFTREVTKPRSIILESFRRFGGLIHPSRIIRVLAIQGGAPFSGGVSNLQGLRGILEIWAPGLFLPSPNLLFGIFLEVIGHLWHQGRIVEELQRSSRTWHLPVGVCHLAQIYLALVFISCPAFGGLFCIVGSFL
jgi:hypothetical protein